MIHDPTHATRDDHLNPNHTMTRGTAMQVIERLRDQGFDAARMSHDGQQVVLGIRQLEDVVVALEERERWEDL